MSPENLGNFYKSEDLRNYEDTRPEWLKNAHMLGDREILRCIEERIIKIEPFPEDFEKCLGPCNMDFHLGNIFTYFKRSKTTEVELDNDEIPVDFQQDEVVRDGDYFALHPGQAVLAATRERLVLPPYIAARMEGRSKVARRTISVQLAAVFHPGWKDFPVLELQNIGDVAVKLRPLRRDGDRQRICSFTFYVLPSPAIRPYGTASNTYVNQEGPKY